jgi:hypothetical protein
MFVGKKLFYGKNSYLNHFSSKEQAKNKRLYQK